MDLMNDTSLNDLWLTLETKIKSNQQTMQQLIAPDSQFRLFIGVEGLPTRRFVSVEIPESQKKSVLGIQPLQGIDVIIGKPLVSHEGFCSCKLQSSSNEQNDVFSIVAQDILVELDSCESKDAYVEVLIERLEKWRGFFKKKHKPLSESEIVGLFGELQFAKNMMDQGVTNIIDFWSGPIKSAQDYRAFNIFAEIKSKVTDQLASVKISSEEQLNYDGSSPMYLVVYRLEKSNSGMNIHELIQAISIQLTDSYRSIFDAKLLCLGYQRDDAYDSKYVAKECRQYKVEKEFPRITPPTLPSGLFGITYNLSIDKCEPYRVDFEQIIDSFKEALDG